MCPSEISVDRSFSPLLLPSLFISLLFPRTPARHPHTPHPIPHSHLSVPAAAPTTAHFPAVNASLRNVFHVLQQQYLNAPRSLGASGTNAQMPMPLPMPIPMLGHIVREREEDQSQFIQPRVNQCSRAFVVNSKFKAGSIVSDLLNIAFTKDVEYCVLTPIIICS